MSPEDLSPDFCRFVKVIVTDLDGTVFQSGLQVPKSTVDLLRHFSQQQLSNPSFLPSASNEAKTSVPLLVIPATGRSRTGAVRALQSSAAAGLLRIYPGVYLNGGMTFGPGGVDDIVFEALLDKEVTLRTIRAVKDLNTKAMTKPQWAEDPRIKDAPREHGFLPVVNQTLPPAYASVAVYSRDALYAESRDQLLDGLDQFEEDTLHLVPCLEKFVEDNPIHKVLIVSHSGALVYEDIKPQLEHILSGDAYLSAAIPRVLEVMSSGVNKAVGLEKLGQRLGFTLSEAFAIGDGDNDIELLSAVGCSVAMGNGGDDVKKAAGFVTSHVDEGGWGRAIESLLSLRKGEVTPATSTSTAASVCDFNSVANVEEETKLISNLAAVSQSTSMVTR